VRALRSSHASNSSSTARRIINRAPSFANSDNRLARILAHSDGKQPVDLLLDLRRRRYRESHGV